MWASAGPVGPVALLMAAFALWMRALEAREGGLALSMSPLALFKRAFALSKRPLALSMSAFALFMSPLALSMSAFALFMSAFALSMRAFALSMSAHEERERSPNRPVRGGAKRMKPRSDPVSPLRGPRISAAHSRAHARSLAITLWRARHKTLHDRPRTAPRPPNARRCDIDGRCAPMDGPWRAPPTTSLHDPGSCGTLC